VIVSLSLLLLDVDGVLNPFAAATCPPGWTEHDFLPGKDLSAGGCACAGGRCGLIG